MTIASLFVALIVTSAADTPGEPVLLDFQATWCGPCRTMRPEVDKLVRKGYPVRAIDIDQSPDLAERYGVKAVPTFIVVDARGRALAKTSGAMGAVQLAAFYNETKAKLAAPDPLAVDEVDSPSGPDEARLEPADAESSAQPALVNPKPWETVVRIKMHLSDTEWGFGSGTIIHSTPDESIILTCAHIFRIKGAKQPQPKDFRVPITVDLFDGQFATRQPAMIRCSEKDLVGQAIDYDFTNDVGLIRIRPGRRLAASRVVPPYWQPKRGMKMYAVGCSHGNDATAWDTTILDPRVGMSNTGTKQSFAAMKCAHQPKEGRSGGGLYTTDGYVAGVCDFADPNEHVGLYAVPEAIHRMLDRNTLMALYQPANDRPGTLLAGSIPSRPRPSSGTKYRGQSPSEKEPATGRIASANPGDITIPPPNFLGIATPRPAAGESSRPARPQWQGSQGPTALAKADRPARRLDDEGDAAAIDPGASGDSTVSTDLSMTPPDEGRAFDKLENRASERPTLSPPVRPAASSGKWRPVRPTPAGSGPSPR